MICKQKRNQLKMFEERLLALESKRRKDKKLVRKKDDEKEEMINIKASKNNKERSISILNSFESIK